MILVVLLAAFAILTWVSPKHAFGLLLAALPTYLIRFNIWKLPTTFLECLIVVFLFFALFKIREDKFHHLSRIKHLNWAAGLFLLSGTIATIVSPEKVKALGELKAFIIEPILLFYAARLLFESDADRKTILRWLLAATAAISIFGLVQYVTFINLPLRFWGNGNEIERIASVFDYPNALALYLAPLLGFFASLWLDGYPLLKHRRLLPLSLIVMAAALVLTFSRGSWLAVVAAAVLILIRRFSWQKTVPILLLLAALGLAVPGVRQRLSLGLSDPSSEAHFDLMKVGVQTVIQSPFLGNGLYGFRTTLMRAHFSGEILNYPHNVFLNFWLELGLLGLVSFALLIWFAMRQYQKHPTALGAAVGVFLVIMIVHGLVDVPYFKNDLSVLFWFMLSLV